MNRALVYELATARFVAQREDALFLGPRAPQEPPRASDRARRHPAGPPGLLSRGPHAAGRTGRGHARRDPQGPPGRADRRPATHHRRPRYAHAAHTAAEDLLELIMRRYERASTVLTSNRPVTTGASSSATPRWSPRSSTGSYIMPTCSSAAHVAGAPNCTRTCGPRRACGRTQSASLATCVVAGFDVSIDGRFWGVHRGYN